MSQRVLVIGATSSIATAVARCYATSGARLFLVARRPAALASAADDLRVRGATEVVSAALDANAIDSHAGVIESAWSLWGGFDRVLVAHGVLPDQAECEHSVSAALAAFDTNARSVVALLLPLAARLESQGHGCLAVISSPAGDRGRKSNYVYGSAKAAVKVLAGGLRHRLANKGVRVITIVPGFVDTPMTASLPKGPLWATADAVAMDIHHAMERGFGVLYTPWFWRWIMLAICHIPERLFVRTGL
jgi:NADP-dependent 3-hydroxy acid dehydrogenase YdfG